MPYTKDYINAQMRVSMHIPEPNHVPLDPTAELTCLSQAPMPELRELSSTPSGPLHCAT